MKKRYIFILLAFVYIYIMLKENILSDDNLYILHSWKLVLFVVFFYSYNRKVKASSVRFTIKMILGILFQVGINFIVEKVLGLKYTGWTDLVYAVLWFITVWKLNKMMKAKYLAKMNCVNDKSIEVK